MRLVLRHVCSLALICGVAFGGYVYSNPYALHRFLTLPYDGFDANPDSTGTVVFESQAAVDFSLPDTAFSEATIAEIERGLGAGDTDDFELMVRCVAWVRSRLNAADRAKPAAASYDAELLYREGRNLYCLCGEHAVLLNEVLQLFQLPGRVLWLEGHVVAEYFDRGLGQWVFVDPHMNVVFQDSDGVPMSAAEVIYAAERDLEMTPAPICTEDEGGHSLRYEQIDRVWYRNILLNGECYALSGTTLRDPSRWSHLLKFRRLPQVLVLASEFDSSHAKYVEPFRLHKYLVLCAAFAGAYYFLLWASGHRRA